jgi:hypothetical protein
MVCAKGLEAATQVKHVKPFIDLEDYPATLGEHKDELFSALDELLTAHPELAAFVKPEIKLALIMSTAAISTASANKQKKREIIQTHTLRGLISKSMRFFWRLPMDFYLEHYA